jgi:hypothetical protein
MAYLGDAGRQIHVLDDNNLSKRAEAGEMREEIILQGRALDRLLVRAQRARGRMKRVAVRQERRVEHQESGMGKPSFPAKNPQRDLEGRMRDRANPKPSRVRCRTLS